MRFEQMLHAHVKCWAKSVTSQEIFSAAQRVIDFFSNFFKINNKLNMQRVVQSLSRVGSRGLCSTGTSVYRGVFPIMATPFHADETLDLDGA